MDYQQKQLLKKSFNLVKGFKFLTLVFLISGCSMSFLHKHEQYEASLQRAAYKLNRTPNDYEALVILLDSYKKLEQQQLQIINQEKNSDSTNWDKIVNAYSEIKRIQRNEKDWSKQGDLLEVTSYDEELTNAKQQATVAHLKKGLSLYQEAVAEKDVKQAVAEFNRAKAYSATFGATHTKADSLIEKSKLKVLVHVENDSGLALPPSFFDEIKKLDFNQFEKPWREIFTVYNPNTTYDYILNVSLYDLDIKSTTSSELSKNSIWLKGDLQLIDQATLNTYKTYPIRGYESWVDEPLPVGLNEQQEKEVQVFQPYFEKVADQIGEDIKIYLFYFDRTLFDPLKK